MEDIAAEVAGEESLDTCFNSSVDKFDLARDAT